MQCEGNRYSVKCTCVVGRVQVRWEGNKYGGKGTGSVGREQVQCEGYMCGGKGTLESLLPFCESRFEHTLNRRK